MIRKGSGTTSNSRTETSSAATAERLATYASGDTPSSVVPPTRDIYTPPITQSSPQAAGSTSGGTLSSPEIEGAGCAAYDDITAGLDNMTTGHVHHKDSFSREPKVSNNITGLQFFVFMPDFTLF